MFNPARSLSGGIFAILAGIFLTSCTTPPKSQPSRNPEAHKQFQALDTNKDGKLSFAEFLKTPMAKKSDNPERLFHEIDTSGDGYITIPEWRAFKLKNKPSN